MAIINEEYWTFVNVYLDAFEKSIKASDSINFIWLKKFNLVIMHFQFFIMLTEYLGVRYRYHLWATTEQIV